MNKQAFLIEMRHCALSSLLANHERLGCGVSPTAKPDKENAVAFKLTAFSVRKLALGAGKQSV